MTRLPAIADPLAGLMSSLDPLATARAASQSLPQITPQEEEGLLSNITGGVLSGLEYVGQTLDKPGRALRGLLAGKPKELLNLIPLSDTVGITDPRESVSGRDLLENVGWARNKPGLDVGDVAGFGVEVALDPLTWIGLPGLSRLGSLSKVGRGVQSTLRKAVTEATPKALSAASKAAGITIDSAAQAEGLLARIGSTPIERAEEIRKGWRSLAEIRVPGVPFLSEPKTLLEFGAGSPRAAKAAESIFYSKFSPLSWTRPLLSANPSIAYRWDQGMQKAADLEHGEFLRIRGESMTNIRELYGLHNDVAGAVGKIEQLSGTKLRVADEIRAGLESVTTDPLLPTLGKYASGSPELAEQVEAARIAMGRMRDKFAGMDRGTADTLRLLGYDLGELSDDYIQHAARYLSDSPRVQAAFQKRKTGTMHPSAIARQGWLRNWKGGTKDINHATSDDRLASARWQPKFAAQYWDDTVKREWREAKADELTALKDSVEATSGVPGTHTIAMNETVMMEGTPVTITAANIDENGIIRVKIASKSEKGPKLGPEYQWREVPDDFIPSPKHEYRLDPETNIKQARLKPPVVVRAKKQREWVDLEDLEPVVTPKMLEERKVRHLSEEYGFATTNGTPEEYFEHLKAEFTGGIKPQFYTTHGELLPNGMAAHPLRQALSQAGYDVGALDMLSPPEFADTLQELARSVLHQSQAAGGAHNVPAWTAIQGMEIEDMANVLQGGPFGVQKQLRSYEDLREMVYKLETLPPDVLKGELLVADANMAETLGVKEGAPLTYSDLTKAKGARDFLRQKGVSASIVEQGRKGHERFVLYESQGLFDNGVAADMGKYMETAARVEAALSGVRSGIKQLATTTQEPGMVRLYDAWKGAKLTDEGLATMLAELDSPLVKKSLEQFQHMGDLRQLAGNPELAARMAELGKNVYVSPEMAKYMGEVVKMSHDYTARSPVLKGYDHLLSLWKSGVYIPWPASVTRDVLSEAIVNMVFGHFSLKGWKDGMRLLRGLPDADGKGLNEWLEIFQRHGIMEATQLGELGQLAGVGQKGFVGNIGAAVKRAYRESESGSFFDPMAMGNAPAASSLISGRRKVSVIRTLDDTSVASLDEAKKIVAQHPGSFYRKVKTKAGVEAFEVVERLPDASITPETRFGVAVATSTAREQGNFINRQMAMSKMMRSGMSESEAAARTKALHLDYGSLSDFERRVMKRLVPFYAFARTNTQLWVEELIARPGGPAAQTVRGLSEVSDDQTPSWLGGMTAMRMPEWLGGDPNSQTARYLASSTLTPIEPAMNILGVAGGQISLRRTAENLMAMTTPLIQEPASQLARREFWSHRNLDDLYQWPFDSDVANSFLAASPASRAATTVRTLTDGRKGPVEKIATLLIGGAKVTDVDIPRAARQQVRDLLEEELTRDRDFATFQRLYPRDVDQLSDEQKKKYALYQHLIKQLKQLNQQRVGVKKNG